MCHAALIGPVQGGSGIAESDVEIAVGTEKLPAYLVTTDKESAAGVVIFHDIYGANDFYRDLARRFAAAGFTTLLPDLFFRQGPLEENSMSAAQERRSRMDQQVAVEDSVAAGIWLANQPGVTQNVGAVGFCMGGTFALLVASRDSGYAATVCYYGFPAPREGMPLAPMHEVDGVQIPILGLWGDQDAGVGMDNVRDYDDALTAADKEHEFVIYPGLPHGFLTFDPASPNFDESDDSFKRTLKFFEEELQA